ncbi:MAG TPA: carbohydrate porin, partial [Stellaceae bacterium]|nr:carbohydrate porin [Stellaceae bacterium]
NEVDLYADAGFNVTGLLPGRSGDTFGLAVSVAQISGDASALDRDAGRFSGRMMPVRDFEAALELTYRVEVTPWWSLQPDLQFIFHPGGNAAPPGARPGTPAMGDAAVIGLRSAIAL